MNRPFFASLALLCLPCLASTSDTPGQPPASPAGFFPAHTYVYLQVNPFSGFRGFRDLKLAKLLEDPSLAQLLQQAIESIPPEADPRAMFGRYPLHRAVGDQIAFGVVGFTGKTRATADTPEAAFHFPEDGSLPPGFFSRIRRFESELLAAIQVTDRKLLVETLLQILRDTSSKDSATAPTAAEVDGIEVLTWRIPGLGREGTLFTAFADDYLLAARNSDVLLDAIRLRQSKAASLKTRSDFGHFARHRGDKSAAALLHIGLDSAIDLFSPLMPRAEREEIAMWGGFDYSGLQLGLGFDQGGICEWFHLAFAENPKGIFMNLARLWPSTGLVEAETSRGTVYGASLSFDWAALYRSTMFVLDLCEVDTDEFTEEASDCLGMDLGDDLLGAVGNTVGALMVLPRHGFIPELSLVFKVRNRTKMEQLVARVTELCKASGLSTKQFSVPGGGAKGTYVSLGKEIPIKPAFALTDDALVISMMPLTLKSAIRKSRGTNSTLVDLLPDANRDLGGAGFSYFFDPAPIARDVYADLIKVLDSSDRRLPIEAVDLPTPEAIAAALSRIGAECHMDPYYLSVDLHSPTGITIPMLIGGAVAAKLQHPQQRMTNN